jgi:hypothetical protein
MILCPQYGKYYDGRYIFMGRVRSNHKRYSHSGKYVYMRLYSSSGISNNVKQWIIKQCSEQ